MHTVKMGKSSCGKRHCIHEQHHPIQADPVFGDLARESSKVTAAAPLRAVLSAGGRAVKESSTAGSVGWEFDEDVLS